MVFRILTFLLLPVICLAQINSNGEKPRGELLSNEISASEMKRKVSFNLEEIKVRWKKAALENCPGVPCITTTVPGAPSGAVATAGNASASVAFTVPNDGGSAITGYTVTSNPVTPPVTGATSPINVTGLMNGTVYTFTVVATNAVGSSVATSATNAVTPSSPQVCTAPQVLDGSGNSYNTIVIGTQCWTNKNLKATLYNDGITPIPDETNNTGWGALNTGARTEYLGATSYVSTYGYLYNWYAAAGIITGSGSSTKNICPLGWHVPTNSDWIKLTDYLGTNPGTQLKERSNLWAANNGTDAYGFSAIPGGYHDNISSSSISYDAFLWSATEDETATSNAKGRYLNGTLSTMPMSIRGKAFGASVRCLMN